MHPSVSIGIYCMHLVCLGVVRRTLNFMRQGPKTCRLSLQHRNIISNHLESLGQLPREFARQPRGLAVLYRHFLPLMVVMSIMLNSEEVCNQYLGYARDLAMYFVKKCKRIYGRTFTVYNVHSLIHLPDDVEYFQCPLDDVSSFPFENYLQTLKKMARQSKNPIAQVTKYLTELEESTKCRHVTKEKFTYVSDTLTVSFLRMRTLSLSRKNVQMAPSFVMSYTMMIPRVSLTIPVIPNFLTSLTLEI